MAGPGRKTAGSRPPAMVRRLAERILRESHLPGRSRYTREQALRIATAKLTEYGYLSRRTGRPTQAGRQHPRKRSGP